MRNFNINRNSNNRAPGLQMGAPDGDTVPNHPQRLANETIFSSHIVLGMIRPFFEVMT